MIANSTSQPIDSWTMMILINKTISNYCIFFQQIKMNYVLIYKNPGGGGKSASKLGNQIFDILSCEVFDFGD